MLTLCIAPSLTASADDEVSAYLSGDDVPDGTTSFAEGISSRKSGYMVYIVDADGNPISPDAKLVSSNDYTFSRGADAVWSINSRLGGYSVTQSTPIRLNAPWGRPLVITGSSWETRQNDIKTWFASRSETDPSKTNAQMLIQGYWGTDLSRQWVDNEYYLVLETIYEFRLWYKYTSRVMEVSDMVTLDGDVALVGDPLREVVAHSRHNAPIVVGNVPGLADVATRFLASLAERSSSLILGRLARSITYETGWTKSAMSSGYARSFPRMEYLTRSIGGLSPGYSGSGYFRSPDDLTGSTGWGMLAFSASDLGSSDFLTDDAYTPPPSGYDGTLYALTSAAGSTTSGGYIGSFTGGGTSETTSMSTYSYSGSCAIGDLYAENCATGDEPYALADRLKGGMSYEGSVPSVVLVADSHLFFMRKIRWTRNAGHGFTRALFCKYFYRGAITLGFL